MQKFRQALSAFGGKAAGFLRAKGYYIALTACIAVLGAAAVVAFSPPGGELPPDSTDAPVAYSSDERLSEAARTPTLPLPTPAPSPTPVPTAIPDFTEAAARTAPPAPAKGAPPVQGQIIWGFAVDSLLYSKTLDQWMTHPGVDVASPKGTAVHAAFAGTVEAVYDDDALGVTVEVRGGSGMLAVYANLAAEPPVREGMRLNAGDLVGAVGGTAISECGDQSHLHFELYRDGSPVDPAEYVLFEKARQEDTNAG